jgi:hypothetical protein
VVISVAVFRHGYDVDGRGGILRTKDDGSGGDADFGVDLVAVTIVGGGFSGLEGGDVPELCAGIGVETVDGAVFGGDDQKIVDDAGYGHGWEIEGLGIDEAVGQDGEELSEIGAVHVGQSEDGLVRIDSCAGVVVVVGKDVLRTGWEGKDAETREKQDHR